MHSLQCVLVIIVNIFFVITHEGVKATLLEKGRAYNHSEDNNNVIHEIVEEVASRIYNKYFKGSHNDKKNEVSVIRSLLNALVRKEQEKAEKNSKVKEKEINDGNIQLFIFDTKSGRLIGRTGIRIANFLNAMQEKFRGSIVMTNTMFKPYSPQRPPGGSGGWKTSGQDPYAPKTSQGGAGSWKTSGQDPHSPKSPQDGSGSWKTSDHKPSSPKIQQSGAKNSSYDPSSPGYGRPCGKCGHLKQIPKGGSSDGKTSGYDPYSSKTSKGGAGGWKISGQGPYLPKTPLGGSEGWKNSGYGPHSPQRPQDSASDWKSSGYNPYLSQKPQDGAGGWKSSGHDPYLSQKPQDGAGGWKSSGHDPYSPHGPLHNDYGWESLGDGEKGYYESSLIIDGRKQ